MSEALQDFGDREETVRKLHDEMFPPAQAGSIGAEQPLDWDSTKEVLAKTIRTERVKALSSDIGHNVSYTYAEGEPVQAFDSGEGSPDTRLDIVARLDMEESRRKDAAIRTREFFAGGVS